MDRSRVLIWTAVAAALAVVLVVLISLPKVGGVALPAPGDITNDQLRRLVSSGARLIDVRTPTEYAGGHLEGAENVPVESITTAATGWDKSASVVVYCQSGSRSTNASQYLTAQGFSHVYNLAGGIAGWDGALSKAPGGGTVTVKATGKPVLYDFASDT